MKRLRVYLDTSVISFLFADDAPEKKAITLEFFEKWVRGGKVDAFVSQVVASEIAQTRDDERRAALNGDGLSNDEEAALGTDPKEADTDGDVGIPGVLPVTSCTVTNGAAAASAFYWVEME